MTDPCSNLGNSESRLFLGLDGGGTKTASVLIDSDGGVVARGLSGPSNSFHAPPEIVMTSVREAVDNVLPAASGAIARAACVLPGAGLAADYLTARLSPATVEVISERAAGFAAAGLPDEAGVVVVAGTGSSIWGLSPSGEERNVGGWGSLLGDEGSGFDIAIRGIRRALKSVDRRCGPSALSGRLAQHFGLHGSEAFTMVINVAKLPREQLAGFAAEVSGAAKDGDQAALEIIQYAADSLAADALFLTRKLFSAGHAFPVVLSGGVFNAGDLIVNPIRDTILRHFPNATVLRTEVPPVVGAARIARDRYLEGLRK